MRSIVCVALLYSGHNALVNTYRFTATEETITPSVSGASLLLTMKKDNRPSHPFDGGVEALCVSPCRFMAAPSASDTGPGQVYKDQDIRFYQIHFLDRTLALNSVLCATKIHGLPAWRDNSEHMGLIRPDLRIVAHNYQSRTTRVVDGEEFIVADGEHEELNNAMEMLGVTRAGRMSNAGRYGPLSWQKKAVNSDKLFTRAFAKLESDSLVGGSIDVPTVAIFVRNLIHRIDEYKVQGRLALVTFLELSESSFLVDDVDEAAVLLLRTLGSLNTQGLDGRERPPILSKLSAPQMPRLLGSAGNPTDINLSQIYDHMVDVFVSSLPRKTPGLLRLARERQIRNIAAELYLSTLAISARDSKVDPHGETIGAEVDEEIPSPTLTESLPTPRQTPSEKGFREGSANSSQKDEEDPAIVLLRSYVTSLSLVPTMGKKAYRLLSHWPSNPGSDPTQYSWESARHMSLPSDDERHNYKLKKKQEARRQREAQKIRKRQRASTIDPMSQPSAESIWGTQPTTPRVAASSQYLSEEIAMTQVEPGAFGGRTPVAIGGRTPGTVAKKKRRKTAGFR
jgi:RNA polymerase I-specific transcription initiation factor RRN6